MRLLESRRYRIADAEKGRIVDIFNAQMIVFFFNTGSFILISHSEKKMLLRIDKLQPFSSHCLFYPEEIHLKIATMNKSKESISTRS